MEPAKVRTHHLRRFACIRETLRQAGVGKEMIVDGNYVANLLPHYWREEADTPEDWLAGSRSRDRQEPKH